MSLDNASQAGNTCEAAHILLYVTVSHLCFVTAFKYLGSFVQNDASQDKELNRRIGFSALTFGKLIGMVFSFLLPRRFH